MQRRKRSKGSILFRFCGNFFTSFALFVFFVVNHRIIITQTAKGGGTGLEFDAMVLTAPCTSLAGGI